MLKHIKIITDIWGKQVQYNLVASGILTYYKDCNMWFYSDTTSNQRVTVSFVVNVLKAYYVMRYVT